MATFALIHGAGDLGWYRHLAESVLRERGHDVVAPDLPCDDDSAGLWDYAGTVAEAVGDRRKLVAALAACLRPSSRDGAFRTTTRSGNAPFCRTIELTVAATETDD